MKKYRFVKNNCGRGLALRPKGRYHATPEGIKDHFYCCDHCLRPFPSVLVIWLRRRSTTAAHSGSQLHTILTRAILWIYTSYKYVIISSIRCIYDIYIIHVSLNSDNYHYHVRNWNICVYKQKITEFLGITWVSFLGEYCNKLSNSNMY